MALDTGIRVKSGIFITDTIEQAVERAGTKAGDKSFDAPLAALEMANLIPQAADRPSKKSAAAAAG